MSGPQLAKRLGVTKARISKAEQDELSGSLTLKSVQAMAEAMGCRFVYAVIPEQEIEKVIKQRALQKARAQVERIATEIVEKMPSDLWNDE